MCVCVCSITDRSSPSTVFLDFELSRPFFCFFSSDCLGHNRKSFIQKMWKLKLNRNGWDKPIEFWEESIQSCPNRLGWALYHWTFSKEISSWHKSYQKVLMIIWIGAEIILQSSTFWMSSENGTVVQKIQFSKFSKIVLIEI